MSHHSQTAFGVYVHIPFCLAKCHYCDFVSRPLAAGALETYLAALEREIAAAPEAGRKATTIFFGGGTPSLLDGRQLARLLAAVRSTFPVQPGAEISIEANPGTLTAAKAAEFLALGVNRVSLGVQSLDDTLLLRLGRRHSSREALAAFALLRAAGFDNVGLDLIHGLPGQSPSIWRRDLARAIDLGPEHLSLYALGIETGTPFAAERAAGRLALPGERDELEMLALAGELTAAAGYERYEISNFARPGRRCRHNLDCWNLCEYRGFGAGAHSFLRAPAPLRLANTPDIDDYVRRIAAGGDAIEMREEPPPRRLAGEALMLGLRTMAGVDETHFAQLHGAAPATLFPEAVELGAEKGWVDRSDGHLRLTGSGVLFSNEIFRLLF
ncbi:MAG: radical SAM family heme chaperone HemW [Candidatus Methylomirabilia bacterium]